MKDTMTDKSVILGRPAGRNSTGDSRTPGSTHGNLSEQEIVEAALRVVHDDGLDKLSMRRLSRELGVSAMAPYYYVSDKNELLDLVATAALAGVTAPDPTLDWTERLRILIDQIDECLAAYPGLGEILLEQMLRKQRRLIALVMEILFDAGFSERNVLAAYATIHTYLFGRSGISTQDPTLPDQTGLPEVVARATSHLDEVHGRDIYRFGVETLLAGLRVQLDRQLAQR
ncbi:TetR family transcriptional regulator [Rhodococcus spelaei]|uniref:TetR family transcriptional regulator n=1 Tax=Rhodococcus spelaei TaxID=2546320 RepID=A0A541B916_9NOCA|nr:mycofactocin system transcriptional regulator MftR2 [Rhodococcus spelaei]TQF68748.1 TetR family transcriptional regulator [Rhodococcus spelaei]